MLFCGRGDGRGVKITQIQTICGTNHEIMKFGNGRMISFLINHENHLLLEADSSALFTANEAPVPAAAKSIALPLTMRDRKSTRLNSSHVRTSRMPSSA